VLPDERSSAIASLEADGLFVTEWRDDADAIYPPHRHGGREVRIVLDGSMTIVVDGVANELHAGDRIDIPPNTTHSATVGPSGVHYLAGTHR
jgi:quercetin dioxygenase-like cupin family protein